MLNSFKWYRRLRGGVWYYNRYIYDLGRGVMFVWERKQGNKIGGSGYNIKTENYEK